MPAVNAAARAAAAASSSSPVASRSTSASGHARSSSPYPAGYAPVGSSSSINNGLVTPGTPAGGGTIRETSRPPTPFMRASYLESAPHSPFLSPSLGPHYVAHGHHHLPSQAADPSSSAPGGARNVSSSSYSLGSVSREPSPGYGLRLDEATATTPARAADERQPLLMPSAEVLAATPVYPLIHTIRVDIMSHIDTPLTIDQLVAPDSTYTIVRPLTEKYGDMRNHAIIFCLMVNRLQFLKDSHQLSISTLSLSRANLCEILAIRVLREWSERSLSLATLLLTPWALFQGASEAVIERAREEGDDDSPAELAGNALEMAILGNAKRFIRSPSAQKVIDGIWSGKIIYQALNQHAIIADNYKRKPIQMYNPHKAPLLDHYRLKVPKIRSFIEYSNFIILFLLYILALEGLTQGKINWKETAFIVYAMGFSLDKLAAMREHGLKVFAANLWNGFDLAFIAIYFTYLSFRIYGLQRGHQWATDLSTDVLAVGAVGMFPRLAFVSLSNNLMILSLRSMLSEFFILMGIAAFCFLGFCYALWTLGGGRFHWSQIGWYLLEVYFGLDASGFEAAHEFHRVLGPVLMISFACLSNTLLLTVLVAILSNTFATINADAAAESMFRKAVSTLEGVKSDAIFSYQLPFNLVAVVSLFPLSFVLSPRWLHKINVFFIRATSFPLLLGIAVYERQKYHPMSLTDRLDKFSEQYLGDLPRIIGNATGLESLVGAGKDLDIVFEIEQEIGDFYRGWDDDDAGTINEQAIEDDSDEQEVEVPLLPPPAQDATPTKAADLERNTIGFPRSPTVPIAGSERQRSGRRLSMPASDREIASTGIHNPLSPPRRKMSMAEPSPLARLFARSLGPDDRFSKLGRHIRSNSILAKPHTAEMPKIDEGRKVKFAPAPKSTAKASELLESEAANPPIVVESVAKHMDDRLAAMEDRQKRIEELLESLVRQGMDRRASGSTTGMNEFDM